MNHDLLSPNAVIDPSDIIVGERLRPLNAEWVPELERSITAIGLRTPVTIRYADGQPTLIAGAHRLQAVKNLGWSEIAVRIFERNEREARMWEIAENLHRYELTVLERSEQLAEWARLAEEVQSVQVDPIESKREDGRGHRHESGINKAARELNIEQTAAKRAVKIDSLVPEAKEAARELGLDDNQSALLEAAKGATAEEQVEVLKQRNERRKTAQKAPAATTKTEPTDPLASAREAERRFYAEQTANENRLTALRAAWDEAPAEVRLKFAARIEEQYLPFKAQMRQRAEAAEREVERLKREVQRLQDRLAAALAPKKTQSVEVEAVAEGPEIDAEIVKPLIDRFQSLPEHQRGWVLQQMDLEPHPLNGQDEKCDLLTALWARPAAERAAIRGAPQLHVDAAMADFEAAARQSEKKVA
jgi:ParB family transcriptional regulator, chromosome partitioning protein